jgi:hypothetical protein
MIFNREDLYNVYIVIDFGVARGSRPIFLLDRTRELEIAWRRSFPIPQDIFKLFIIMNSTILYL